MERDPSGRPHRRGRRRGRRRVQADRGAVRRVRPGARARHADQRAGDHRRGDGRGDDRPAPDRRAHVLRLLRGDLGHGRQPDRQDALHDRRPGLAAARASAPPTAPGLRFGAQHSPERRELGDGDPRAQGRGAVDAGRRHRADGRRDPRPRPGDLLRAQGALRRSRARSPTASTSTRSGRAKVVREGPDATIVALAAMVPRALEAAERLAGGARHRRRGHRPALARAAGHGDDPRARSRRRSRLFTVEENPRLCGWGAEIVSIVADEAFYSLDAPIVRITTPHIPLPSAAALEDLAIPSVERIVETVSGASTTLRWTDGRR